MKSFWQKLKKPFLALAPMDDVTDTVFRQIIAKTAPPDVFFTEFTSVSALCSDGQNDALRRLKFSQKEKPIIAQIWGNQPEKFAKASKKIAKMGFAGIDINLGCPDRKVIKNGSGAALIKNPTLTLELIKATRFAAPDLSISVKTRLGYKNIDLDWIKTLLAAKPAAITIHLRTVAEMSKVPAHWEEMNKIIELKNQISPQTVIIGNGDVMSYEEAQTKAGKHQVDGIMIGRGVFTDPYIFSPIKKEISLKEGFSLLLAHVKLFEKTYHGTKNFNSLRKFFKMYINNFPEAAKIRNDLMPLSPNQLITRLKHLASD